MTMIMVIPSCLRNIFDKRIHPAAIAAGGLVVGAVLGYGLCIKSIYSSRPTDE